MSSAVDDGSRTIEAQAKDITSAPECNIVLGLFVFFARLFAITALVAAAGAMGSAEETLPFFTHDFQFHASFEDFPALALLVFSDIVVVVYLCLSILFSLITIARPTMVNLRVFLLVLDLHSTGSGCFDDGCGLCRGGCGSLGPRR
ncbi:hypothetical protein HPP92_011228 [Vanilla planifolia]|uniref:CASP-like protein n=1 Tax=Vanilla planifolia TaxID=51239 RepID=A0A835V0T2_VANPL|nr:hypothetical protein HPP92_011496 [Vanilla planifolia]KAG0483144.1 hypothetical protein HPP92_011228 [Vanilla planifolia]